MRETDAPDIPGKPIAAGMVSLRTINAETVREICTLAVAPAQSHFVAPNAISLAQALFSPQAWYRAIYLDDMAVGFVMLADDTLLPSPPTPPQVTLWRFMIDQRHQGKGVGRAALALVTAHVRAKGRFATLGTSYVPGPGSASGFYQALGFRPTGEMDEGEIVATLAL